jgi:hypothetical protein
MSIPLRLKQMFLSERTVIYMQWHKDCEKENKEVTVQSLDLDMWKDLDNFDPEFAQDTRNFRIGHNLLLYSRRTNVWFALHV